jgi:UDP-glucuronate 4-epimerase
MKALVTGGAGFIGSHVVDRLLSAGWTVTTADNFDPFYDSELKLANIAAQLGHPRFELVRCDIRDLDALRRALPGGYDVIVHLAAKAGVRPSILDPAGYQQTNVVGTQNMLELAAQWDVRQFVFASSSSVYGVNPDVPWRESDAVLKPISPYAATKVAGELLGHVYSHLRGIRFLALRFFTVYGPRQRPDLAIHKLARLMLEDRPVPVYGDGNTKRDYTYIADIVDGIMAAITYRDSMYEVINLGNCRTVSLMEMIGTIERCARVRARIDFQPEQPGDVPQTYADISKARRLLGYNPSTPFDEGVRSFLECIERSARAAYI